MKKIILSFMVLLSIISAAFVVFAAPDDKPMVIPTPIENGWTVTVTASQIRSTWDNSDRFDVVDFHNAEMAFDDENALTMIFNNEDYYNGSLAVIPFHNDTKNEDAYLNFVFSETGVPTFQSASQRDSIMQHYPDMESILLESNGNMPTIDDAKQAYNRDNPPPSDIILADSQGAISQEERHNKLNVILNEDGTVSINNGFTIIEFSDAQPFVDENGRTQVPIRAVAEMLDCTVDWDGETKTVTVTRWNGDVVSLVIGSDIMTVNGEQLQMDTAAIIKDDRTYIPVRFVAEAVGYEVDWIK